MKQFLLLHGPNLNLLGRREPGIYGSMNLSQIEKKLMLYAQSLDVCLAPFQSNHEQTLCWQIQQAREGVQGIIINAGAYTHTGHLLAETILQSGIPTIEVHISNVYARESFRHHSLLTPVCQGAVCGLGFQGYLVALHALIGQMA